MSLEYSWITQAEAGQVEALSRSTMGVNDVPLQEVEQYLVHGGMGATCYLRTADRSILIGYALYRSFDRRQVMRIDELLVHPDFRRQKIGSHFVHQIMQLARQNNYTLEAYVPEASLATQLLLSACGWHAGVVAFHPGQDRPNAYIFRFPFPQPLPTLAGSNSPAYATK